MPPGRIGHDGGRYGSEQRNPRYGPSELGLSGTLLEMTEQLPRCGYLHCPDGSHLSQYIDLEHYFPSLVDFLLAL